MNQFKIHADSIPVDAYQRLREITGLSLKSKEAAEKGLANCVYSVLIKNESEIVGMGRIVGDGGCFCQIVDIAVDPRFQGLGLGKLIMANLMSFVEKNIPDTCHISLLADGTASNLYEKFGFVDALPYSRGMIMIVK